MKLTARERQICELLKKDPLLSQDELAQRLGITRSSVAVHISNLIKKGIIVGRGYVFNKEINCVVIGECFEETIVEAGFPSRISTRLGGFVFRCCQGLQSLKMPARVITCLGQDRLGDEILSRLQETDVDLGLVKRVDGSSLRVVQIIKGKEREIYRNNLLRDDIFGLMASRWEILSSSDYILIEPVYLMGADRLLGLNRHVDGKPVLCTCLIDDEESRFLTAAHLAVIGVNELKSVSETYKKACGRGRLETIVLTDGTTGVLAIKGDHVTRVDLVPGQGFDTRSGLPAFLAGLVYGLASGYELRQALRMAIGNASD